MSLKSEVIINRVVEIAEEYKMNLFEALAHYCVINDLDEYEVVKDLDQAVVERLKVEATEKGYVRECTFTLPNTLI